MLKSHSDNFVRVAFFILCYNLAMAEDKRSDIGTTRKIATAKWIITARWFYPIGVLVIGLVTKNLSQSNVSFSYGSMVFLFTASVIVTFILWLAIKRVEKKYSAAWLNFVRYGLTGTELLFFTIIMHNAGGVESVSNIFFFLPIVGASLLFGASGSIIVALLSGLIINLLVLAEYYNFIPHVPRYDTLTFEFTNLWIGLTKTTVNAIFFLIVGVFAGYSAKMLFRHETSLIKETNRLDEQTKRLKEQEAELTAANSELKKKIGEIATFQKLAVDRELRMVELKEEIKKYQGTNK